MAKEYGRLPTIPEYYMEFINPGVNLLDTPKQCCPFHKEDTPSFSYDPLRKIWSCFGSCHARGKDVIDMHMRWYHLQSRDEAEQSLNAMYEVSAERRLKELRINRPLVDLSKVEDEVLYNEAVALATTPERWLQLDYIMSKTPLDKYELIRILHEWKGIKSVLD